MTLRRVRSAVVLAALLGLAACGGGGGGSDGTASTPSAPPAPPPPVTVVGNGQFVVVDQFGYLSDQQKVAVLRDPITGYDSNEQYTPGATIQVIDTASNTVAFTGVATQWKNGETGRVVRRPRLAVRLQLSYCAGHL